MRKRKLYGRARPGRRWPLAVAALPAAVCIGVLAAGCGGGTGQERERDEEVHLRPATEQGPDPYTATSARTLSTPVPEPVVPGTGGGGAPERGHTLRTMSGATPGLYGGTRSVGSCDVERQLTLLRADDAKAGAFADGADVSRGRLPAFLRGLTPVVLRADTRVSGHGYRAGGGAVPARQLVLQAGTAVLVDRYGVPRVRCASGTPLSPPVAVKGGVIQRGAAWKGYRTDRVVVVKATTRPLESLVIVDVSEDTWIDRATGTDGEEDRRPDVVPPVNPDDVYAYPAAREQEAAAAPDAPDDTGAADDTGVARDTAPGEPLFAPDGEGAAAGEDYADAEIDPLDPLDPLDGRDVPDARDAEGFDLLPGEDADVLQGPVETGSGAAGEPDTYAG
ncbi:DUF6777 domain-containing protein [Streptomyces sp. NPDC058953]|uniref:DUF6777 domain-containing protein n=1 Tax=unclassified Streptomyces TaxID=2593676 RepID=UPI0036AFDE74